MDPRTELRKVPTGTVAKLIQILDASALWTKLMMAIPKYLDLDESTRKYNAEHTLLIENAAATQKRPATEILFEEWGTSGKVRPTLGHLLQLLTKAELYRAADFVAEELLHVPRPQRPKKGPAAEIDTSLTKLLLQRDAETLDSYLEKMPYPISVSQNSISTFNNNMDNNLENHDKNKNFPLHMSVTENESKSISNMIKLNSDVMIRLNEPGSNTVSDMIELNSATKNEIPALSELLTRENSETSQEIPSLTNLLNDSRSVSNVVDDENSSIQSTPQVTNQNVVSFQISEYQTSVPNISILQDKDNVFNTVSSEDMPMLSLLQDGTRQSIVEAVSEYVQSSIVSSKLPQFNFDSIKKGTNEFNPNSDILNLKGGKIGEGGFGEVFLAFHLIDKPTAVKRLFASDNFKIVFQQFKAEIETLVEVKHKNIVSVLGYSNDGPYYCIVYEYIDGGSLRENLDQNCLSSIERINIALGTARGLEYLHNGLEKVLIHRDVKSTNILLTKNKLPKLCDFGLAKIVTTQNSNTSSIIGTEAYMAPEAFGGDTSVQMDVFSFGVVLLELITNLPPVDRMREGNNIITYVRSVCANGDISPLVYQSIVWPSGSTDSLYSISNKCFKEKYQRPFIKEICNDLEKVIVS